MRPEHLASALEKEDSHNFIAFNKDSEGGVNILLRDDKNSSSITLTKENFCLLVKNLCQHL